MTVLSAEDSIIARSPAGISTHDMPGGWCVIVARTSDSRPPRTWYYKQNDHPRLARVLKHQAEDYIEARIGKRTGCWRCELEREKP